MRIYFYWESCFKSVQNVNYLTYIGAKFFAGFRF